MLNHFMGNLFVFKIIFVLLTEDDGDVSINFSYGIFENVKWNEWQSDMEKHVNNFRALTIYAHK